MKNYVEAQYRIRCTEADALCGPWRTMSASEERAILPESHVGHLIPKGIYGTVIKTPEGRFQRIKVTFQGLPPDIIDKFKQEALDSPNDWRQIQQGEIALPRHVKRIVPVLIYGNGLFT